MRVGLFDTENCKTFEEIEATQSEDEANGEGMMAARDALLSPIEAALGGIEHLNISSSDAVRLVRGQPVLMRGRDAPIITSVAYATNRGKLIALVECDRGTLSPIRVFNLPS